MTVMERLQEHYEEAKEQRLNYEREYFKDYAYKYGANATNEL